MSAPDTIYVYRDLETDYCIKIDISKTAGRELLEKMLPSMQIISPEFADSFEVGAWCSYLSITDLPTKHFPAVYRLFLQACDELASVAPFKAEIKAALEADPRYQETLVAMA